MELGRMKFPRHWALGSVGAGLAWGWSDVSREAAQAEADRRARSLDERLRGSQRPELNDGYYPGRPIREEVLREFGREGRTRSTNAECRRSGRDGAR